MFSKNISLKNSQSFENTNDKKQTFLLNIEIKSNHNIDPNTLMLIENHINTLMVINYKKLDKDIKK